MLNTPSSGNPTPAKQPHKRLIRTTLVSRNVTIAGHRTSVRLEPDMWSGLIELCRRERATLHQICSEVAKGKKIDTSLTAAIRVHIMNYYRAACTEDGHIRAGHGTGMRLPPKPLAEPQSLDRAMPLGALIGATSPSAAAVPASRPPRRDMPFAIGGMRPTGNGGRES